MYFAIGEDTAPEEKEEEEEKGGPGSVLALVGSIAILAFVLSR